MASSDRIPLANLAEYLGIEPEELIKLYTDNIIPRPVNGEFHFLDTVKAYVENINIERAKRERTEKEKRGRGKGRLNFRQEMFCQEMVARNHHQTDSAIAAGFAKTSAAAHASRLLKYDNIQARIAELLQDRVTRAQVTSDSLLAVQAEAAFLNVSELYDDNGVLLPIEAMPKHVARNIAEVEVKHLPGGKVVQTKYKLVSKEKSREMLMREKGMLTDKLEVKETKEFESDYLKRKEQERIASTTESVAEEAPLFDNDGNVQEGPVRPKTFNEAVEYFQSDLDGVALYYQSHEMNWGFVDTLIDIVTVLDFSGLMTIEILCHTQLKGLSLDATRYKIKRMGEDWSVRFSARNIQLVEHEKGVKVIFDVMPPDMAASPHVESDPSV